MNRFWKLLADMPSTKARIGASIVLGIATGIRVLISWSAPPWEWCLFLLAWGGLDIGQYAAKRFSHCDYIKAKNGGPSVVPSFRDRPPSGPGPTDGGIV